MEKKMLIDFSNIPQLINRWGENEYYKNYKKSIIEYSKTTNVDNPFCFKEAEKFLIFNGINLKYALNNKSILNDLIPDYY